MQRPWGDQKIKYYDVTSLYPYINKVGKVPLGHPQMITEKFRSIDTYKRLIKCKILPPKGIYIPILPYRANGKLLFPLCRTCARHRKHVTMMRRKEPSLGD